MADIPTPPAMPEVPEVPAGAAKADEKGAKSEKPARGGKSGGQSRASRNMETRAAEQRQQEWKPPHARSTLSNDNPESPWVYRWLRHYNNGQEDRNNMEAKLQEGYELVSPHDEDVKERVARGELHAVDGVITRGGRVLARIPRRFAEQRNQYYTDQARLQQQTVDQTLKRNEHESMPLTINAKRRQAREG